MENNTEERIKELIEETKILQKQIEAQIADKMLDIELKLVAKEVRS